MSKARELLDVLARFIPTIAGIQPLALILDNIECADSVSLELLEMLMREDGLKYAANTGLFIIATCQTDDDTYPESIERFLDRIANRHGPENKPTETIGHMTTHLVARNDRVTCVEMFHSSLEEIKSWTIANSAT